MQENMHQSEIQHLRVQYSSTAAVQHQSKLQYEYDSNPNCSTTSIQTTVQHQSKLQYEYDINPNYSTTAIQTAVRH